MQQSSESCSDTGDCIVDFDDRGQDSDLSNETVNRVSCDTTNRDSNDRLCWHTGDETITAGWRCGGDVGVGDGYERIILQRNGDVPSP